MRAEIEAKIYEVLGVDLVGQRDLDGHADAMPPGVDANGEVVDLPVPA
jgi:hypothetical protein